MSESVTNNTKTTGDFEPIQGRFIPPAHWWQPTRFELQKPIDYDFCTVPAGFVTDGLSLPQSLKFVCVGLLVLAVSVVLAGWPLGLFAVFIIIAMCLCMARFLFPRFGDTLRACILHDYLLSKHGVRWQFANYEFFKCLKLTGVATWRRVIIYFFVTVYFYVTRFFND